MTLSSPPSTPIDWLAVVRKPYARCIIVARTWYEARAQAAVLLGADPQRVKVTPMGGDALDERLARGERGIPRIEGATRKAVGR